MTIDTSFIVQPPDDALATPMPSADYEAIGQFFDTIVRSGDTHEVRIPKTKKDGPARLYGTQGGYFTKRDAFVRAVAALSGRDAEAVYLTLNPTDPDLGARASNRLAPLKTSTSDTDIVVRRHLLLDIDPVRASGISATDEERDLAVARRDAIQEYLTDLGFPHPVWVTMSGNGGGLIYRIDLPNQPEAAATASTSLVSRCLAALASMFNDEKVKVDTSVSNAARITKIVGTVAAKGDHVPDLGRVWRRATGTSCPDALTVPTSLLELVAGLYDSQPTLPRQRSAPSGESQTGQRAWDIRDVLDRQGIGFKETSKSYGTVYSLDECLTSTDHADGAAIIEMASGALSYRCHHERCSKAHWADVRGVLGLETALAVQQTPRIVAVQGEVLTSEPGLLDAERPLPYRVINDCIVHLKATQHGVIEQPLTNFDARILASIAEDDGSGETRRLFHMRATIGRQTKEFTIPADQFAAMNWPIIKLGSHAILFPGQATKEHARTAIQLLSGEASERTVYTHTGWRDLVGPDGKPISAYLHAGGAIGPIGPISGVDIRLHGSLEKYSLPSPTTQERLQQAILASLKLEQVADRNVMIPLMGAVYRAPLGPCDFGLFLAGPTGVGKSEVAALAQQHWGKALDSRNLPASWSSTANALEGIAFLAKDALLVVDDFAPRGSPIDVQRYHQMGDRLFRAQGNNSGRGRMRADGTIRQIQPPRGLIVATGEDVPTGQSIRGRLLIIEADQKTVHWDTLGTSQREAADGMHAEAMAGYVQWVASRRAEITEMVNLKVEEWRDILAGQGHHQRLADSIGNVFGGWCAFLGFALEVGAINNDEWQTYYKRVKKTLSNLPASQSGHQSSSEPAHRFIELIGAALTSGRAHLTNSTGGAPDDAVAYGWAFHNAGHEESPYATEPRGFRVGWIEGEDLYLFPDAAFQVAQQMGSSSGEPLAIQQKTLSKRLDEQGMLASTDEKRRKKAVRKMFAGVRREVWHLRARILSAVTAEESAQSAQSAHVA